MFQKLFGAIALSALLISFSLANDPLAKPNNGTVSDNSIDVKILSPDETKEVRGGYAVTTIRKTNEFSSPIKAHISLYAKS